MSFERTICKQIDYSKEIAPFPLIKIYSGVGSGKSYFAARMVLGAKEYGIPQQNVLIVTSRRSKVNETLKELGVAVSEKVTKNGNLNYEVWKTGEVRPAEYEPYLKEVILSTDYGDFPYTTYNKSVVCTNAYISAYLRYVHDPDDPTTHLWNKFDAIIIDEVHSLVTDATYQAATFDVFALIQEYLKLYQSNELQNCACKRMILMTGTPQPFDAFASLDFPEELTNTIDLFEKCDNVVPKNVILVDKETAWHRMRTLLSDGEKAIYFSNGTLSEAEARSKFSLSDSVAIGVSFSNEGKRKKLTKEERDRLLDIDESLAEHSVIPDDIRLFVTTSRNKEGININNNDYRNMFVETHLMYDAVQMAGRVRSGVDNLYIITNAEQMSNKPHVMDILFSKKIMVANDDYTDSEDQANKYLQNEYVKADATTDISSLDRKKHLMNYVKYIENRFDYVRYHVFEQKFKYFRVKEAAEELTETQEQGFAEMLASGDDAYIKQWFPYSTVRRELPIKEQCAIHLHDLIGKEPFVRLTREELWRHLSVVRDLFNSRLKQANAILRLVDEKFNCNESGSDYILYYGTEDPRVKKKAMGKRRKG